MNLTLTLLFNDNNENYFRFLKMLMYCFFLTVAAASLQRSSISRILQAGEKRSLPSYIPDHYPPFPDPHTYIRTPVSYTLTVKLFINLTRDF